jgi:hypothetical protein
MSADIDSWFFVLLMRSGSCNEFVTLELRRTKRVRVFRLAKFMTDLLKNIAERFFLL